MTTSSAAEPVLARVSADSEICIGAGNCFAVAAQVFDLDEEDGTVVVLRAELTDADEVAGARSAAAGCPAVAIVVTEP